MLEIKGVSLEGLETITFQDALRQLTATVGATFKGREVKTEYMTEEVSKEFQLEYDGETIFSGFIDNKNYSIEKDAIRSTVSGRSRCGILNDSAIGQDGSFESFALKDLAEFLTSIFRIEVNYNANTYQLGKVVFSASDTPFEIISKYANRVGAILTSSQDGGLEIIDSVGLGNRYHSVIYGETPIVSLKTNFDYTKLYSAYRMTKRESAGEGIATYSTAGEYPREKIFYAETTDDNPSDRVEWLKNRAISNSEKFNLSIKGYNSYRKGDVIIFIGDTTIGKLKHSLLIDSINIEYSKDAGIITHLNCLRADAYISNKNPIYRLIANVNDYNFIEKRNEAIKNNQKSFDYEGEIIKL